jgi:hypothetical protein
LLQVEWMHALLVSVLLSASVAPATAPVLNAQWCATRHEKLATLDRKAIVFLKAWERSRRTASLARTPVSARKTVETTAILDRLLELGQEASVDAARCTSAGFRSTPAQRAAYRRNELDFRTVELLLAQLHDSWTNLIERDRETLLAEVRKSGLLETL